VTDHLIIQLCSRRHIIYEVTLTSLICELCISLFFTFLLHTTMLFLNAHVILLISSILLLEHTSVGENKYSADANKFKHADSSQFPISLRELDKPFRMAKLNIVWIKAKNVSSGICIN